MPLLPLLCVELSVVEHACVTEPLQGRLAPGALTSHVIMIHGAAVGTIKAQAPDTMEC